jgi:hypothetical protein
MARINIDSVKEVLFPNFAGEDRNGRRSNGKGSFAVSLYPEDAKRLSAEGFKVKKYKRNDDDEEKDILNITVNFRINPYNMEWEPKIYECPDGKKAVLLARDSVKDLDRVNITNAHLVINPYSYNGAKYAYLTIGYFDIDSNAPSTNVGDYDPFEGMYTSD